MKALFKKEVLFFLNTPVGYLIVTIFALFVNFLFIKDLFLLGTVSMQSFYTVVPWIFIVFIPAIAMRALSEERRSNTIETLLTLPLSEIQIVLAKFGALMGVVLVALALTVALPISLSLLVKLYLPEVLVGYIGLLLLGGLFVSISLFCSSLTKNQVVAFLLSAVVLFFLTVIGSDFSASVLPKIVQDTVNYFSPLYHLDTFGKGVLDIRSMFYFLSFITLFLFLTVIDLEKRA